jgi:hypothetical protein
MRRRKADIEARIAGIERTLRTLKTEVKRRKKAGPNGPCLASVNPEFIGDEVHRRKLRRKDLRNLGQRRLGEILDVINAAMERCEPEDPNGPWRVLKHNRDLVLEVRAETRMT